MDTAVPAVAAVTTICPACGAFVRDAWPGCLICGVDRAGNPLEPSVAEVAIERQFPKSAQQTELRDRPGMVLAAVFGAMMFLGIPLIWSCRRFSTPAKVFWTIATLVYSAVVFYAVWLVMLWSYHRVSGP
jgi:hypothetical protein